ncbi:efflux RND transporter periplasmic adaptor subunit [Patescibacteria group bacterium]|nr:efflux RND transporter periplasmic adaptor subunit [Patescibacteria group bacterium]
MLINILKRITHMLRKLASWLIRSSWKKKVVFAALILIIAFFAGKRFLNSEKNGYIFDTAQKRTVTEIISESGIITTNGTVNIYSPTNGVIEDVFVSNSKGVSEGQELFTVKSTATQQEKTAAFAAYQVAASALQQAENTRRSTEAIVDRVHDDVKDHDDDESFLQKETRTTAEVANDNAYDGLVAARAQLTSAQVAYQATQNATVTAPISGVISNLSVTKGGSVIVNAPLAPTSPALKIGNLRAAEAMISVGESDINKIEVGQEASVKTDAVDDKIYKGVVTRVDETGTVTQGVVGFNVYIDITDLNEKLKAGMTVDVDIVTNKLENVLAVPATAVKPYQKGRAVRKLNSSGEMEFLPIKMGVKGKEFAQIIEGLAEGQKIIVSLTNEKAERKSPFGF